RSGAYPAAARYQAGRKPDHPRVASLPGSVPRADSAQAPSDDTFCSRTHSSWLSTSQENEGSGCRERYYRLRAPAQQLWYDQLDRFFRGQPPRGEKAAVRSANGAKSISYASVCAIRISIAREVRGGIRYQRN